ncbi:MAG TPA: hypothetical protein VF981_11845 [Gemmatimonadaceae bacterium]
MSGAIGGRARRLRNGAGFIGRPCAGCLAAVMALASALGFAGRVEGALRFYEDDAGSLAGRIEEAGRGNDGSWSLVLGEARIVIREAGGVFPVILITDGVTTGQGVHASIGEYAKMGMLLALDAANDVVFLGRTAELKGGGFTGILIPLASRERRMLRAGTGAPRGLSGAVLAMLGQVSAPPAASTATVPAFDPAMDEREKIRFFLASKNHPYRFDHIPTLTSPRREPSGAATYQGVLQRSSARNLVLTTWTGDVTLKIRQRDRRGAPATYVMVSPSPSHAGRADTVVAYHAYADAAPLDAGQFVTVFAGEEPEVADWVQIYQESDP